MTDDSITHAAAHSPAYADLLERVREDAQIALDAGRPPVAWTLSERGVPDTVGIERFTPTQIKRMVVEILDGTRQAQELVALARIEDGDDLDLLTSPGGRLRYREMVPDGVYDARTGRVAYFTSRRRAMAAWESLLAKGLHPDSLIWHHVAESAEDGAEAAAIDRSRFTNDAALAIADLSRHEVSSPRDEPPALLADPELILLGYDEAALVLGGVNAQLVRQLVTKGHLTPVVLGERTHRFTLASLIAFIRQGGIRLDITTEEA